MTDAHLALLAADLQATVTLLAVLCDPDAAGGGAWKVSIGGQPAALVQRRTASWIDGTAEQAAHRLAAAAGLSPKLLHVRPDLRLVLTEWVDSEVEVAPTGAAMAARLAAVHALPVHRDAGVTNLSVRAAAMLYRDHLDRQPRWDDHVRTVLTYPESGEPVLCHRDPTPGNWLCGSTLQLIDWEYASLGDRWFDLAALIEGWAWSEADARLATQAYVEATGSSHGIEQLHAARAAYRALISLWTAASPAIA